MLLIMMMMMILLGEVLFPIIISQSRNPGQPQTSDSCILAAASSNAVSVGLT